MRSKEVEEAIDLLENGIADYIIEDYCIKNENKLCGTYCEKMKENCIYNQAIDKVIEYIEELEEQVENYMKLSASSLARGLNESIRANEKNKTELELLNEGWKQTIRDKIKELEEKYVELSKNKSSSEKAELNHEYIEKRSLLESLLGE